VQRGGHCASVEIRLSADSQSLLVLSLIGLIVAHTLVIAGRSKVDNSTLV
jgi:hypothetical protein